jgi:hypothetical protein
MKLQNSMKIVYTPPSQLCNKLWSIVNSIARSLVLKEKIVIVDFEPYKHFFPNIEKRRNICIAGAFVSKILMLVFKISIKINFFKKKTAVSCLIDGWSCRHNHKYLDVVFDDIHFLFSPSREIVQRCETKFDRIMENADIVIGIHLRRGDYKTYKNGRYYYDDQTNVCWMNQMSILFTEKKVAFFIASNEPVNLSAFIPFDCFISEINSPMDDLFSLSLCDYIIGPPSTYSMWASFYGKKPLRILDFKNEKIHTIDEFEVIITEDLFESGRKWIDKYDLQQ